MYQAIKWISPKIQLWIDNHPLCRGPGLWPTVHRSRLMSLAALHAENLHDHRVVRDRHARLSAFKYRCWARRTSERCDHGRSYLHSSECHIVPWCLVQWEKEWRGWIVVHLGSKPRYRGGYTATIAMYKVSKLSVVEKRAIVLLNGNPMAPVILDEILNTTPASDLAYYISSFNQVTHKG